MIGIIGFSNLRLLQYLDKYTNILDKHNISYEVIYWNRDLSEEIKTFNGNAYSFDYETNSFQPFKKKILGFIRYVHFVRKMLRKKKYDKLIVLTTPTAIPLYDILLKKYKNNYIYDYRDVTKERYGFYKKMVKKLVNNSYFTSISSLGFKKVIGESDKYVMSHNCSNLAIEKVECTPIDKIRVAFWGTVRNAGYNKHICDVLGNDERFVLSYHGTGTYQQIVDYCKQKNYKNIFCTGRYDREQIADFAQNTDILLCAYPNDRIMGLAMPVKLYDSIRYGKPIILGEGLYMTDYVRDYKISYNLDLNKENIADEIYNWYNNIDKEQLADSFSKLLDKINADDNVFETELIGFANL